MVRNPATILAGLASADILIMGLLSSRSRENFPTSNSGVHPHEDFMDCVTPLPHKRGRYVCQHQAQ